MIFINIDSCRKVLNFYFLKQIWFMFIIFNMLPALISAQDSVEKFDKLMIEGAYQRGSFYLNQIEESSNSLKLSSEYFFTKNKSLWLDFNANCVSKNSVFCNIFEKGLDSYKITFMVNSNIIRDIEQTIDIKMGFGWEWVYFDNNKNYNLTGFSFLLSQAASINLYALLKIDLSIFNTLKVGVFRGELNPVENNVKYSCALSRTCIESGFIFPAWKCASILLFYQSDLYGQEISENGLNLGIHIKF